MPPFPRHILGQFQDFLLGFQEFSVPMIFENAPHALKRIILAMIGRIIGQFQKDIVRVGKFHQPPDELGSMALIFRAIIHIQHQRVGLESCLKRRSYGSSQPVPLPPPSVVIPLGVSHIHQRINVMGGDVFDKHFGIILFFRVPIKI